MIAHVSIPARNPFTVAKLLAKVTDASVFAFPVVEGAYIVVANDDSGSAIEVYPVGMSHHPGQGAPMSLSEPTIKTQPWEDQIYKEADDQKPTSHHMAVSSRLTEQELRTLGEEHGFRVVGCDRAGVFKLVELWIDNSYLVEVLSGDEYARYKGFMRPAMISEMFGSPL